MALKLILGNQNYSSWSLRPWLALKAAEVRFEEQVVPLGTDAFKAALSGLGTAERVPVLLDGTVVVWDSLAIIEYVAERYTDRHIWPTDPAARAMARSISAEVHSGFSGLRRLLPMNLWRPVEVRPLDEAATRGVERISAIWGAARARFGGEGDFLFGRFCAADAMYAPVASRLLTYGVELDPVSTAYVAAIHAQPDFCAWRAAALKETWVIPEDEVDWPVVKRVAAPDA